MIREQITSNITNYTLRIKIFGSKYVTHHYFNNCLIIRDDNSLLKRAVKNEFTQYLGLLIEEYIHVLFLTLNQK